METSETYDPNCKALAEHFLSDEATGDLMFDRRVDSLSRAIQQAIEAWFATHQLPSEPA
jgi:hypothetical protein